MNYDQALDYIHSFLKFGSKPGLERVSALLEKNGDPHDKQNVVHVAGTNGKGSISTMISNALICSGKKTGLFTSPYVSDFCERMQVDGKMIPHEKLCGFVEKYSKQVNTLNSDGVFPTEFELITAIAYDWFYEERCDYSVMEVGLGGLYDSTNVVKKPAVSVIAHIDRDHEQVLGSTLKEIALQKCGIIKDGCPCVLYPEQYDEVFRVVEDECKKHKSELIVPDLTKLEIMCVENFKTKFLYDGKEYCLKMTGHHQVLNAVTAIEALNVIGCGGFAENGLAKSVLPARIEVLSADPLVILDGAHNPDGAKALYESLKNVPEYIAVLSVMEDKDVDGVLKYLLKNAKKTIVTKCENPRAMSEEKLASLCRKYCGEVEIVTGAEKAVKYALDNSGCAPVVVCGSLYLASEVRDFLKKTVANYK